MGRKKPRKRIRRKYFDLEPFVGLNADGLPRLHVGEDLVAGAAFRRRAIQAPIVPECRRSVVAVVRSWRRTVNTAPEFLEALAHVHTHAAHEIMHAAAEQPETNELLVGMAFAHLQLAGAVIADLSALTTDRKAATKLRQMARAMRDTVTRPRRRTHHG